LQCVGPQQQLKQRFGQGYTVKLNFNPDNAEHVDRFVKEVFPTAALVEDFAGSRSYQIPTKDIVVSELFNTMQAHQEEAGKRFNSTPPLLSKTLECS